MWLKRLAANTGNCQVSYIYGRTQPSTLPNKIKSNNRHTCFVCVFLQYDTIKSKLNEIAERKQDGRRVDDKTTLISFIVKIDRIPGTYQKQFILYYLTNSLGQRRYVTL